MIKIKDQFEFEKDDTTIEKTNKKLDKCLNNDHTIAILFKAEQQQEKTPIWLVGDEERKFIEYPLIRKLNCWTWGLSFNNSRTVNNSCISSLI